MSSCYHTPRCGSASVHHARRNHDARRLSEISRVPQERASRLTALRNSNARDDRGVPSCKANPALLRGAVGRAPWELTAEEFEAVCEPWFELSPFELGKARMFGLSISEMRFGLRLRLVILGGPEEGYVADVDAADEASLGDARRAFVVDALGRGLRVPPHVLADYPDLPST